MSFKSEQKEKMNLIVCPPILGKEGAQEFKKRMSSWLLTSAEFHVLDFKDTESIDTPFYQAFLLFRSSLKGDGKNVFAINLSSRLLKQIKSDGLENSFSPMSNLEEIHRKQGVIRESKNKIDLDFIAPFLKGAKAAFEIQCNTPIQPLKPYLKKEVTENIAIAAVLSLTSPRFQGTVVLAFPEKVFLKIYENMFEEVHESITKESEDAAAELLNIVYGAAKVELNQKGYDFPRSLPTVLTGQQIRIRQTSDATTVVLPFESGAGIFFVEIESEKS